MSSGYISLEIRRKVAEHAKYRCSYCLTSRDIIGPLLEIDHIIPEARGGTSKEENLTLACPMCNRYKSDNVDAVDPVTGQLVDLFNPRNQIWEEHFEWDESGTVLIGTTSVGRATIVALNINQIDMVSARQRWVSVGWHPPS